VSKPFEPGDVVVCLRGCTTIDGSDTTRQGAIYRVSDCRFNTRWEEWGVWLAGMNCGLWFGYKAARFRKIDADTTEDFRQQMRSLGKAKDRTDA
jgi:hypothetical protein